jgi:hypothetical protein
MPSVGKGPGVVAVLLIGLAVHAKAQDMPTEETPAKGLRLMYDLFKMAERKEAQCMRAVGNKEFCSCISTKLLKIDFIQYVEMLAKTDEEMSYDKRSPEDKQTIDTARRCRDLCLAQQAKH